MVRWAVTAHVNPEHEGLLLADMLAATHRRTGPHNASVKRGRMDAA